MVLQRLLNQGRRVLQTGQRILRNSIQNIPKWRKRLFDDHVLLTNIISSGILMCIGDALCQFLVEKEDEVDGIRMLRMGAVGCLNGAIQHAVYQGLDYILPGTDYKSVFSKIGLDQLLNSSSSVAFFLFSINLMEGKTIQEAKDETRGKFYKAYVMDCCYWTPLQIINFRYLKPKYRVIYVNALTIPYNLALSYFQHVDDKPRNLSWKRL